jgi:signal transduction histidine kinase
MGEEMSSEALTPAPAPAPAPTPTADVLVDFALELGHTLDLDRLLPLALARVTRMLGAERALFALYDVSGRLERAVTHNLDWAGPGSPLPVSQGLIDRVIEKDEVILIADARSHATFKDRGSVQALDIRFMVGVPVRIEGHVGGVICIDSRTGAGDPSPQDIKLLTALARLVGTAVESARVHEHQRFRTTLLARMAAGLRAPIQDIALNAGLLARVSDTDAVEARAMALEIAANAERMAQTVANTMALSAIEAGAAMPSPDRFDVRRELERHLQPLSVVARPLELGLELDVAEGLPAALTVPAWVWVVFDGLVYNAMVLGARGSVVRVKAGPRSDRGPADSVESSRHRSVDLFRHTRCLRPTPGAPFVEVRVESLGRPAREARDAPSGSPAQEWGLSSGLGLDLAIADQCARHLGGSVWLDRWEDGAASFCFSLPTALEAEREARASGI